jgi:long-chain fatty acid transport protein
MVGAPGGSGGFNARVTGAGPASTYFNPALLSDAHESFGEDFYVFGSSLSIQPFARPEGADVGESVSDAWQPDGNSIKPLGWRPLPTSHLAPRQSDGSGSDAEAYIGIGMVKRFTQLKATFGVLVLVPAVHMQSQSAFYNDEREQFFGNSLHFELLGDRLTLPTISFGLAAQVLPKLSIGFGFSLAIATDVTTPVYVADAADYSVVQLDNDLSVSSNLAEHGGLVYKPIPNLALALTVHQPFKVKVTGKNVIRVADSEPVDQLFTFVNGYEPAALALGAAWTVVDRLELVGTLTYRDWDGYEDRHGETTKDPWKKQLTTALGARWNADCYTLHLDGQYVPSPVPTQDGRSNYVDNSRLGLATGVTIDFGARTHASLALQAQRLLARHVYKSPEATDPVFDEYPDDAVNTQLQPMAEAQGFQTNNPGYPGYASSGWLFGAGISLETWF